MNGTGFKFKKHHEVMMERIQATLDGHLSPRLGFFMPPGHAKTLIGADLFLTYMFGRFPHRKGVYGTYNEDFAITRRDTIIKILTSDKYNKLFPNTRIKSMLTNTQKKGIKNLQSSKEINIELSNALSPTGKLLFVARGGRLTGERLHYGACDDLYKSPTEAESEKINKSIFDWFVKVWLTRPDQGTCFFIIFYTRWVENDVAGKLISYNEQMEELKKTEPDEVEGYLPWNFYRFPAYKDDKNDNVFDTRKEGELLDPDFKSVYIQQKIDPISFEALYQQNPTLDSELRLFKQEDFRFYSVLPALNYLVISLDTTFKGDSKTIDRTAFTLWGTRGFDIYFHPYFVNKKMNFDELEMTSKLLIQRFSNYFTFIIEDSANGPALYSRLKYIIPRIKLWPVKGKSKRERAQYAFPYFATGHVYFPDATLCPKISDVISQFTNFTGIKKNELDDIPDTCFQTLQFYNDCGIFRQVQSFKVIKNCRLESYKTQGLLPSTSVRVLNGR